MHLFRAIVLVGGMSLTFFGCTSELKTTRRDSTGDLALFIRLVKPASLSKTSQQAETEWDSLVIEVSSSDQPSLRFAYPLSATTLMLADTLAGIAAGANKRVECYTKNTLDSVIHRSPAQTVDIQPQEVSSLTFQLDPVCGSILVSLMDVPVTVDSVHAQFKTSAGIVRNAVGKRTSSKVYLSIDYVPDNAAGTLTIAALGGPLSRDTLYVSRVAMTFHANTQTTISAPFASAPGALIVSTAVVVPGVTVVAGNLQSPDTIGREYGPLIISEVHYSKPDSEYIEIFNTSTVDTSFDTLLLEVDGVKKVMTNVSIAAKSFFVISRKPHTWLTGVNHLVVPSMDLVGTGNWLALRLKTRQLVDWVAFGTKAIVGWPVVSSTVDAAIVLDSLSTDPRYNNYGINWQVATSSIGTSTLLGSPGIAGK